MAFTEKMPKETRLWYSLAPVKTALIVFTCIGSKIGFVNLEPLPKFRFCAADIFFVAAFTL